MEGEARVDEALRGVLEAGEIGAGKLSVEALVLAMAETGPAPVTAVAVDEVELASFDELLDGGAEVAQ